MYNQVDSLNLPGGTQLVKRAFAGDIVWLSLLLIITAFLVVPQTQQVFIQLTNRYPYGMGFIKFAILATMGECFALRLAHQSWVRPIGMIYKIIVWGLIGVLITFMFSFYSAGISALANQGIIPQWNGFSYTIFTAFLTSAIMNLTFGIVFMAMHRMSDTYIEMRVNNKKPSLIKLIKTIDWGAFISFVVIKTIPMFWIPVHTITFALPAYYRVVVAAYLSIILGVILAYSSKKPKPKVESNTIID